MAVRHLYTLLCDYVLQDAAGKNSYMGVFQSILLDEVPGSIPQFFLVVAASVDRDEGFIVKVANQDRTWEQHLATGIARGDPGSLSPETDLIAVFAARLVDLIFPELGRYQILVLDGDEVVHSFPFAVQLREQADAENQE
jgi:hypothetical protein